MEYLQTNYINKLNIEDYTKINLLSFIKDRNIFLYLDTHSTCIHIHKGCPQGSCKGPILWLIVEILILKCMSEYINNRCAFADDFVILVTGNMRQQFQHNAKELIHRFISICNLKLHHISHNTHFSRATLFMSFTCDKRQIRPNFKLGNESIKIVLEFKYLSLICDFKLKWFAHLRYLHKNIYNKTIFKFRNIN